MIMDIVNIAELVDALGPEDFVGVMQSTFELIEERIRKYNCFKVDITGNYFILGAGTGEFHVLDHCVEFG